MPTPETTTGKTNDATTLVPVLDSPATDYKIKLEAFEGPLDLLLHLIKRHEIDIYDIPMARVTAEYLAYIHAMRELDIDLAGEFLVMAATLIHIKSRLLLPADPDAKTENGEIVDDPRADLVRQLLEHQRYKAAAHLLWSKREVEQGVFTRAPLDQNENAEITATVFDLLETFKKIVERRRERIEIEIAREEMTQAHKMAEIRALLKQHKSISATRLFEEAGSKREMVCIFLAILELLKETVIIFRQERTFGDIFIERAVPTRTDRPAEVHEKTEVTE